MFQKGAFLRHLVIICFLVTVFVYPFAETLLVNRSEFSFKISGVTGYAAGAVLFIYLALALAGMLLKQKEVYTFALFALTVAAYLQQMFMNGELFLMDGINDK